MDRWDALLFVGLTVVCVGLWLVSPTASMVTGGGALCVIALRAAPSKGNAAGG